MAEPARPPASARAALPAQKESSLVPCAKLAAKVGGCDAALVPAAPGEAPIGLGDTGNPIFNRMWTLLGVPCVTPPARWGENGLPTGVQLVGRAGGDTVVMGSAAFLERALVRCEPTDPEPREGRGSPRALLVQTMPP